MNFHSLDLTFFLDLTLILNHPFGNIQCKFHCISNFSKLGLLDSPLCRKCGVREETSAHILCECEALASPRRAYLGSFLLEPEDVKSLGLGAIWNYTKVTGLP